MFFVDTTSESNQAQQLSVLNREHSAVARAAGANLGLFAVGRKLIFVEGQDASMDRLVYHRVAQRAFPDAYIMPLGSVENLLALRNIVEELSHAVFGLELFMVRDRDGLSDGVVASLEGNPRFRCLPRRHVENYLLEPDVLAKVAQQFYLDQKLGNPEFIARELQRLAEDSLMSAVLWNVREYVRTHGAVAQPKIHHPAQLSTVELATAISDALADSLASMADGLRPDAISKVVQAEHSALKAGLSSGTWQKRLPGKLIFNRFCGEVFQAEAARVREAYVDIAMTTGSGAFDEIATLLRRFAECCVTPA